MTSLSTGMTAVMQQEPTKPTTQQTSSSSGAAGGAASNATSAQQTTSTSNKVPIHLQSSQQRLLIKNGRIVNDDQIFDADIYIENGIIAQIGNNLIIPGGVKVIDAKAESPNEVNYVLPGGIDSHTHFASKFMNADTVDDYYSGSRAAIAGGTTTIVNFVLGNQFEPQTTSNNNSTAHAKKINIVDAVAKERALADSTICCDYALHAVISEWKDGGVTEAEIKKLILEHGVNTFKVFLCYPGLHLNNADLIKVLQTCAKYGAVVLAHCENGDLIEFNSTKLINAGITGPEGHIYSRPECVEAEATLRMAITAYEVGCPVLVAHCMSKSAAEIIAKERCRNSSIFGETLVAAIATDGTNYFNKCWKHAAAHVLSPPLRPDSTTPAALLGHLAAGGLQIVGSDHCTFNSHQKAMGEKDFRKIPNGVNGVEERMILTWEKGVRGGYLDPCKFVAVTSTNAAKLFNMYPRKGKIQVGSDADLVIWGRSIKNISSNQHMSKCDTNIFEGMRTDSGPLYVICAGKIAADPSGLHVSQGSGKYIVRQPFPIAAYGPLRIKNRILPPIVKRTADGQHKVDGPSTLEPDFSRMNLRCPDVEGYHNRGTRSGVRNMQDSTFKLTGEQIDDKNQRSNIRVSGQPPGGRSTGLW